MKAEFINKAGEKKPIIMGCYGIGVGRLMAAIVEYSHDKNGIIWPKKIAPFQVHLISLGADNKIKDASDKIYNDLQKNNIEILYDDRNDKSAGEKLAEADLIGIPIRLVISEKTLAEDSVEIKKRNNDKIQLIKIKELIEFLN